MSLGFHAADHKALWRNEKPQQRGSGFRGLDAVILALCGPSTIAHEAAHRCRARRRSTEFVAQFIPAKSAQIHGHAQSSPNRRRIGARQRCAAGLRP